jgi:ABC-2 type transport system permease protein
MSQLMYDLRVAWAVAQKDLRIGLTERFSTVLSILLPLNFLILLSLFAISGGLSPTAVVMNDTGPLAQQFYQAMAGAHSFRLQQASAAQAQALIQAGKIVAVVTIPANFDAALQANQPVVVDVQINNLNTDFTNDIRRAVPLSITSFYAKAYPRLVNVTAAEHDLLAQDTDYIPYLTVSILVVALMMGGLLPAGTATAREWENGTIKELLLSPASRWAIGAGQMLGAGLLAAIAAVITLLVLILLVGVWPMHWGEVVLFTLLTIIIFVAWGTLLGTLLKKRQAFMPLAFGTSLPLFFISGAFGPLSFLHIPFMEGLAEAFPVYYAIVLQQHAFHGFDLNTLGVALNALVLVVYAAVVLGLAGLVLQRSTMSH